MYDNRVGLGHDPLDAGFHPDAFCGELISPKIITNSLPTKNYVWQKYIRLLVTIANTPANMKLVI